MDVVPLPPKLTPRVYVALAAADTALAASSSPTTRRFRMITKPLLMPALGTAFMVSLNGREVDHGGLLRGATVAAQALSGVGDIALLRRTEPAFLTGLSAFFGAHIAYMTAFADAGRPLGDREALGGVAAAAATFALTAPVMGSAAGRKSPALRAPVIAYAGILSSMFAASTRLDPSIPTSTRRKVVAGTGLFLASDTILGLREFVLPRKSPWTDAAVMATYTAGQALIAAGVSEAVRSRAPRRASPLAPSGR
jgi:uncharacterized membrane protein YhhN